MLGYVSVVVLILRELYDMFLWATFLPNFKLPVPCQVTQLREQLVLSTSK